MHLGKIHVWKIRHEQYPQLLAHCQQQNELGRFSLILMICCVLEKITSPICPADVDPGDTYSYIGSTYLARFLGIYLETFHPGKRSNGRILPFRHPVNSQRSFIRARLAFPSFEALTRGVHGRLREIFQNLRVDSMTQNEGNCRSILHRGTRIPNRPATFFSPRHNKKINQNSRVCLGRASHGVARATESLRRLRYTPSH